MPRIKYPKSFAQATTASESAIEEYMNSECSLQHVIDKNVLSIRDHLNLLKENGVDIAAILLPILNISVQQPETSSTTSQTDLSADAPVIKRKVVRLRKSEYKAQRPVETSSLTPPISLSKTSFEIGYEVGILSTHLKKVKDSIWELLDSMEHLAESVIESYDGIGERMESIFEKANTILLDIDHLTQANIHATSSQFQKLNSYKAIALCIKESVQTLDESKAKIWIKRLQNFTSLDSLSEEIYDYHTLLDMLANLAGKVNILDENNLQEVSPRTIESEFLYCDLPNPLSVEPVNELADLVKFLLRLEIAKCCGLTPCVCPSIKPPKPSQQPKEGHEWVWDEFMDLGWIELKIEGYELPKPPSTLDPNEDPFPDELLVKKVEVVVEPKPIKKIPTPLTSKDLTIEDWKRLAANETTLNIILDKQIPGTVQQAYKKQWWFMLNSVDLNAVHSCNTIRLKSIIKQVFKKFKVGALDHLNLPGVASIPKLIERIKNLSEQAEPDLTTIIKAYDYLRQNIPSCSGWATYSQLESQFKGQVDMAKRWGAIKLIKGELKTFVSHHDYYLAFN